MRGSPARGGQRWRGVLRSAERLLVVAGIAILAWCAVVVADASLAQRAARRSLEAMARVTPAPPRALPTSAVVQQPRAIRGGPIAALSIPRIDLSVIVLHGSDDTTLRRGPGHLEGTPMPGDAGNVVFAGHRDSFFRPLRNVQAGDDIFVDTPAGRFHYRVTSLSVVDPHDLSVVGPTGNATLTLITCYPFWVLGNAPDRFVVRAARVVDRAAAPLAGATTSLREPVREPSLQPEVRQPPIVHDDEALVRQAIEQFRLTYNARLVSHNDRRPEGPLRFEACDIAIVGDRAAATCAGSSRSHDDGEPYVWTFTFEGADRRWAIRSILTK
jgi:sortase A